MRRPKLLAVVPAAALALALGQGGLTPAAADWLLMKDGSRVETRGPWQVRGAQVVFTMPNGTLASVRADSVDLEGSARITAEAKAPKPAAPAPPPKKAAVLTITEADIPPSRTAETDGEGEAASADPAQPAAAAAPAATSSAGRRADHGLVVTDWEISNQPFERRTTISGTVRNTGNALAFDIELVVSALDAAGELLAKSEATLGLPGLAPGTSTTFEVIYSGVSGIESATFDIAAQLAAMRDEPARAARPSGAAQEGEGEAGEGDAAGEQPEGEQPEQEAAEPPA